MSIGTIQVEFRSEDTGEVVGVQTLAFERVENSLDNTYLVQQYHEIPGHRVEYLIDIQETFWNEGHESNKEITFVTAKAFGKHAARNLQDLSDGQLDDLYEKHIGYRAIEGGDTRENVVEVLSTWHLNGGEVVTF